MRFELMVVRRRLFAESSGVTVYSLMNPQITLKLETSCPAVTLNIT